MKFHIERGEYSERTMKFYFALLFLRSVFEDAEFTNLMLHGLAQILAEHPEDREEILEALRKQTRFYEEILPSVRGVGSVGLAWRFPAAFVFV